MRKARLLITTTLTLLVGCDLPFSTPFEALGNLVGLGGTSAVTVIRGGDEAVVTLEIRTNEEYDIESLEIDTAVEPTGGILVTRVPTSTPSTPAFVTADFAVQATSGALLQARTITFTTRTWVCPLRGECNINGLSESLLETDTYRVQVIVQPSLGIEITAPLGGLSTGRDLVSVEATITDRLEGVTLASLEHNGSLVADLYDGAPIDALTVAYDLSLTSAGANAIVIVAANATGEMLADTVEIDYQPLAAGEVRWDGDAGDNLWTTATNWDTDALPGPDDNVFIDDAGITVIHEPALDTDVTTVRSLSSRAHLEHRGGTLSLIEASEIEGLLTLTPLMGGAPQILDVGATLTVAGGLQWDGGNITGGAVNAPAGPAVTFGDGILDGATLNVGGVAAIPDGAAVTLVNGARLTIESGAELRMATGNIGCGDQPCTGSLENRGTISINSPGVWWPIISVPTTNHGAIAAAALQRVVFVGGTNRSGATITMDGQLVLQDWILENGSSLTASSVVVPEGSLDIQGTLDVDQLTAQSNTSIKLWSVADVAIRELLAIDGGAVELWDDLSVNMVALTSGRLFLSSGSVLSPKVSFTWMGGTLAGPGSTVVDGIPSFGGPDAVLMLNGSAEPLRLDGHRLVSADQTNWANGDIEAGNGAVFVNFGLFDISSDHALLGDALGGITTFENEATIRKIGGSGTTTLRVCYDPGAGATLDEQAGTVSIVQPSGCP